MHEPNTRHSDIRDRSELTILTSDDVDAVLSSLDPEEALASQAKLFKAFSAKSKIETPNVEPIQTPQRISLKSEEMTALFMPSRVASAGGMGCKIVSLPTKGGSEGLPATTIIMNEITGKVRALINARKLTALRNACGSALSLKALPTPRPPTHLLIFGSGGQAQSHALIFLKFFPTLTTLTFIIRKPTSRSETLKSLISSTFPKIIVEIGISNYPQSPPISSEENSKTPFNLSQTVHNANIIITVTPSKTPLFNSVDVTSQTHLILIGSYTPKMKEVDTNLIKRAGLVLVDSKHACEIEAGELIQANVKSDGMIELGELLSEGEEVVKRIRESGDITVFKSVGLGIQDVAIANLVLAQAEKMGLGTLVPDYD